MKPPHRAQVKASRHPIGSIIQPCPKCGAAPGMACRAKPTYDDHGNPFVRRILKNPHRERKAYPSRDRVQQDSASTDEEGSIMGNDAQRQQQEEQRRQEQQRRQEEQRRQQEQQGQQPPADQQ